jgi:hypothetical protein
MNIPAGTRQDKCVACEKAIFFVKTAAGKSCPVDPDGVPHFATCTTPETFRGKTRKEVLRGLQGDLFGGDK